jgi:hypothetical protein
MGERARPFAFFLMGPMESLRISKRVAGGRHHTLDHGKDMRAMNKLQTLWRGRTPDAESQTFQSHLDIYFHDP